MKRPRILALISDGFGGRGGIAQYNRDFLRAAATLADVEVLPRLVSDPLINLPAGVRQRTPPSSKLTYFTSAVAAATQLRPAVVFCGHLNLVPVAVVASYLTNTPLVIQCHGIEIWDPPSPIIRAGIETAAQILCVSRDTRARVLNWSQIPPERVRVLPNTVGGAFSPRDRIAARSHFGINDELVILSVGRLDCRERYKGQDKVIEILPSLRARGLHVTYLVAGEGDDRPRLEALAEEKCEKGSVRFLGAVPSGALPDLYCAADLFVLPSSGEGFGIVFLEALACGTPALALSVGGAKDALADGALGILSRPEELERNIISALAQPRPDPLALSKEVNRRFGTASFTNRVINQLCGIING